MAFIDTHPNYNSYNSDKYYFTGLPINFIDAVVGFSLRYAEDANELKKLCLFVAKAIPTSPPSNWGYDYLKNDLEDLLYRIENSVPKVMDYLDFIICEYRCVSDVNELLTDFKIGYLAYYDSMIGVVWELVDEDEIDVVQIEKVSAELKDEFKQVIEHIKQAINNLGEKDNARALKNSIRDCLSALESFLKKMSNTTDIKDATKILRDDGSKGPDIIVKDGLSIWNHIHQLYPDIRHGQSDNSNLSYAETKYWIERILSFLTYMNKQRK